MLEELELTFFNLAEEFLIKRIGGDLQSLTSCRIVELARVELPGKDCNLINNAVYLVRQNQLSYLHSLGHLETEFFRRTIHYT